MHIPDNYLSPSTCAVMGAVMIPIWKVASRKVKEEITKKKIPILGVCAAVSFLIMMFNVPVPGGTTAHATGAVLAAILIGPYAATISVTIALLIQALFFGDGGILAFAANCFNIAFAMPFVGYFVYRSIKSRIKSEKGEYIAVFLAGYFGILIAAFFTAVEFGIQPMLFKDTFGSPIYCPYGLNIAIPAMVLPHLLVGLLEGAITAGVYIYIKKMSPGIIYEGKPASKNSLYGLIVTMIVLCPLGLLATGTAWGEWGADEIKEITGFVPKAFQEGVSFNSIMPDYTIMGMSETTGYILSAIAGVAIILILFKIVGLVKKDKILDKTNTEDSSQI